MEEEREGPIPDTGSRVGVGGTRDEEQEMVEERQGGENPILFCRPIQGL